MTNEQDEVKDGYTRVTTILSPFSGLNSIPDLILKPAQERGNAVDRITQAIMDGIGVPNYEEKYKGYIESFNAWKEDKIFIDRPPRLYCNKYMITGEIDRIYQDAQGNNILMDIKTPAKEGSTWRSQLCAYSYLCSLYGYKIDRIEAVKLLIDGKYPKIYQYEDDFEYFLEDYKVYNKYHRKDKIDARYFSMM